MFSRHRNRIVKVGSYILGTVIIASMIITLLYGVVLI